MHLPLPTLLFLSTLLALSRPGLCPPATHGCYSFKCPHSKASAFTLVLIEDTQAKQVVTWWGTQALLGMGLLKEGWHHTAVSIIAWGAVLGRRAENPGNQLCLLL